MNDTPNERKLRRFRGEEVESVEAWERGGGNGLNWWEMKGARAGVKRSRWKGSG